MDYEVPEAEELLEYTKGNFKIICDIEVSKNSQFMFSTIDMLIEQAINNLEYSITYHIPITFEKRRFRFCLARAVREKYQEQGYGIVHENSNEIRIIWGYSYIKNKEGSIAEKTFTRTNDKVNERVKILTTYIDSMIEEEAREGHGFLVLTVRNLFMENNYVRLAFEKYYTEKGYDVSISKSTGVMTDHQIVWSEGEIVV